jgi:hypothetical protein
MHCDMIVQRHPIDARPAAVAQPGAVVRFVLGVAWSISIEYGRLSLAAPLAALLYNVWINISQVCCITAFPAAKVERAPRTFYDFRRLGRRAMCAPGRFDGVMHGVLRLTRATLCLLHDGV